MPILAMISFCMTPLLPGDVVVLAYSLRVPHGKKKVL